MEWNETSKHCLIFFDFIQIDYFYRKAKTKVLQPI